MSKGFYTTYDKWIYHGKGDVFKRIIGEDEGGSSGVHTTRQDNEVRGVRTLLHDVFGVEGGQPGFIDEEPFFDCLDNPAHHATYPESAASLEDDPKYKKLLDSADEELYEGCTAFSKLSFILLLFHLKCMHKWSGESFTMLLRLIGDAFPQITDFPQSYYEGKKMINDLGLGYQKIHACPNDCVLYWGDNSNLDKCPVCGLSRWKSPENSESCCRKVAAKVMRYFPLIPRLLRIYRSSKMAGEMRWHEEGKVKDGKLRHPSDGLSWQDFNKQHPEFAADPRSVRLGLASDGFNPYRLMSTNYSTWPVVLIPYNLPPWLCMKSANFILSVIIPGKCSPGLDIDVYLQPLIHELKQLWDGVDAFDAHSKEKFSLKAALTWTINDFPAYAMLSGWSTKGYKACPICTNNTPSSRFANKICYTGFRKWLPFGHVWCYLSNIFNGKEGHDGAPAATTGEDVLRQQENANYVYGKNKPKTGVKRHRSKKGKAAVESDAEGEKNTPAWSKKSIFFPTALLEDYDVKAQLRCYAH